MGKFAKYVPWVLGLLAVGAAVWGISALFRGFKGIGSAVGNVFGNSDQDRELNKQLLAAIPVPPVTSMSITMGDAQSRANRIQQAMETIIDTDEDTIYACLRDLNGYDITAIFLAFGERDYFPWGYPKNMYEWFDCELDDDEKGIVAGYCASGNPKYCTTAEE